MPMRVFRSSFAWRGEIYDSQVLHSRRGIKKQVKLGGNVDMDSIQHICPEAISHLDHAMME